MCLILLHYLCKETSKYPSNITLVYKSRNYSYTFRLVLISPQEVSKNAAPRGRNLWITLGLFCPTVSLSLPWGFSRQDGGFCNVLHFLLDIHFVSGNWNISVSIVTSLWAWRLRNLSLIPGSSKRLSFLRSVQIPFVSHHTCAGNSFPVLKWS